MRNFGVTVDIQRLVDTEGAICFCFLSKQSVEIVTIFFLECPGFKRDFESIWNKLKNIS